MILEKKQAQLQGQTRHWFQGGQGTALVLLPGFGGSNKTLLSLGKRLAERYCVFLPESPGFGEEAALPPADYAFDRQIAALQDLIALWGLERFYLGGNSAGGQLACLYAAAYPNQVAGLVLLCPQGVQTPHFLPYAHKEACPQNLQDWDAIQAKLYLHPPQLGEEQKRQALQRLQGRWEFLNQVRAVIRSQPQHLLNQLLPRLKLPMLLLWGAQDGRIPTQISQEWVRLNPNIELFLLEHSAHLPQIEEPAQCCQRIEDWISAQLG